MRSIIPRTQSASRIIISPRPDSTQALVSTFRISCYCSASARNEHQIAPSTRRHPEAGMVSTTCQSTYARQRQKNEHHEHHLPVSGSVHKRASSAIILTDEAKAMQGSWASPEMWGDLRVSAGSFSDLMRQTRRLSCRRVRIRSFHLFEDLPANLLVP